ncbi:membrane-targeted effector domain-containing toxin [Pseudomonas sp. H9]|uniref:membrane-targeted effector domain-containing toxin n=1 Tax=Pseudomonas sp. H9 TaxID=483968 RepID=UPI0010577E29|nr:membrane-targeted effector domain-containing toxin [Pseudomonas sp. H9]TDF78354.1 membrane-targeted effector domain-containing toxin [Pseudomonas sp. H9]
MSDSSLSLTLRNQLSAIARRVVLAFPDLHADARKAALNLLKAEGVPNGNPDHIYWHRFSQGMSTNRTFTGWQHFGTPEQSLTLTELVIRRFRVGDQDSADVLPMYGGFYSVGPDAGVYNETNEVRLEPERVLKAFWVLDFGADFQRRSAAFWADHGEDVRTLAKLNYLSEALQAGLSGQLDALQLQLVFDAVGFDSGIAPQLQHFEQVHSPQAGIQIATLSLCGQVSTDVIWLKAQDGHYVLYLPGAVPSFQGFDSEAEVAEYLFGWLQVPKSTEQLLAHFTAEPQALQALRSQLQGLAKGSVEHFVAQVRRDPISGEVFAWVRDSARQRMINEADAVLRTNSELRIQLWIGYLNTVGRLLGYMVPAGWPLALLVVAIGVARVALNAEQAVDGDTLEERHAGVVGSILAGVDVLLNLPFLIPLGKGSAQVLDERESNALVNVPAATAGPSRGISTLANGGQYIEISGLSYRVRYDSTLGTWLIVPEENPFSFAGGIPVRMNEAGQWEVFESPCLRAGGQCMSGMTPEQPVEMVDYSAFEVPAGSYEVPTGARPAMLELINVSNRRMLSGDFFDPESPLNDVCDSLQRVRQQLSEDASGFFAGWPELPYVPLAEPVASVAPQRAFLELLEQHEGLVIGESHGSIASKRWLMDNFKAMYDKGVRTLYLEHLMSDMHQVDLDAFAHTGQMTRNLESYLRELDAGHFTDPGARYNFLELVRKARANRISVQAIDCVASYRLDGLDAVHWGNPLRQKMMNYYAHQTISIRQAARPTERWVALVGNTHSNFYKKVPGVAELQGVPGLRIVDAGPGQATGITLDPGEYFLPSMGKPDGIVQGDLRLALQTKLLPVQYLDPVTAPPGVIRPKL